MCANYRGRGPSRGGQGCAGCAGVAYMMASISPSCSSAALVVDRVRPYLRVRIPPLSAAGPNATCACDGWAPKNRSAHATSRSRRVLI